MNLLVVDWDFFFPVPEEADWSHAESMLYIDFIWHHRATDFLRMGLDLPTVEESWRDFWDRFTFAEGAQLWFAESNCRAVSEEIAGGVKEVWLYDAHHDSGYHGFKSFERGPLEGRYDCEDWMLHYYANEAGLHVRYPLHRPDAFEEEPDPPIALDRQFDDGEPNPVVFDRVFVCRSGAWVPPWCDEMFDEFVNLAAVEEITEMDLYDRSFDRAQVEAMAVQIADLYERAVKEAT